MINNGGYLRLTPSVPVLLVPVSTGGGGGGGVPVGISLLITHPVVGIRLRTELGMHLLTKPNKRQNRFTYYTTDGNT
jgi:hypothetical protein